MLLHYSCLFNTELRLFKLTTVYVECVLFSPLKAGMKNIYSKLLLGVNKNMKVCVQDVL